MQAKRAWLRRIPASTWTQHWQVRLVFAGGTATKYAPLQAGLHSSWRRNSAQPWYRGDYQKMARDFEKSYLVRVPPFMVVRLAAACCEVALLVVV